MRQISWLHISDIHMRTHDAWAQRVVMRALCDDVAERRAKYPPDFVLVTGDLAYAGKAEEYALVERFLDDVVAASGVSKELIFCVPGNHDIDRARQRMCFRGARAALQDPTNVDAFLGDPEGDDFRTLAARQESYRTFQKSYFSGQDRVGTDDGLGYVSRLTIDGVRVAILGLDTSWLANGGAEDHMKLLLGERQILNALSHVVETNDPPHVIVSMGHHPLHLLQDFDRRTVQMRIEGSCHFYHCGHLHEPEARPGGPMPGGCLTIAAGASFETRQSPNAYSFVTLNLLRADRTVTTHRYVPATGRFNSVSTDRYSIEVKAAGTCDIRDLARELAGYGLDSHPYYLAALILEKKAEVPVPTGVGHTMASLAALDALEDCDLKRNAMGLVSFRTVLRVLFGAVDLSQILADHGGPVRDYASSLRDLCKADSTLRERLGRQEADARALAEVEPASSFSHTVDLWRELADSQEWDLLRESVEPYLGSSELELSANACRLLALGLASSDSDQDTSRAIELYRELVELEPYEPSDAVNLARLLVEADRADEAKAVVIAGIADCPETARPRLHEVGQAIVESTGDRGFRDQLTAALAERRST